MSETGHIAFTVLGRPEPQGSSKGFIYCGKDGKQRVAITSDNPQMKNWRQNVGWCALDAISRAANRGRIAREAPVRLTVSFFLQRPVSVPKRRIAPTVKPDVDKLVRAVSDALTGIVWEDDAQIVEIVAQKSYGLPERTEIVVEAL